MPRQGLNRSAVIEAAIEFANQESFQALSLGSIARKLAIKPPSLYKHINSLEDLQDELGIRGATELTKKILSIEKKNNPKKELFEACLVYRNYALEHKALYDAIQPAMNRRSKEFQNVATLLLESIIPFVFALKVPKKNLIHAVRSLRSLLHGFIELERQGGFGMPEDINDSFKMLIKIYTEGISVSK